MKLFDLLNEKLNECLEKLNEGQGTAFLGYCAIDKSLTSQEWQKEWKEDVADVNEYLIENHGIRLQAKNRGDLAYIYLLQHNKEVKPDEQSECRDKEIRGDLST